MLDVGYCSNARQIAAAAEPLRRVDDVAAPDEKVAFHRAKLGGIGRR